MVQDRAAIPVIPAATEIAYVRLPEAGKLFSARAERFAHLAAGHAMDDYLRFMSDVAMAQHRAAATLANSQGPTDTRWPLAHAMLERHPEWQPMLRNFLADVASRAPADFSARLGHLAGASAEELDAWADAWLKGDFSGRDTGLMSLVAAGLQVFWTAMAGQLDNVEINDARPEKASRLCPVCGSLPVASIVHSGSGNQGLRYLCCSLCATQWHRERIHCVSCGDSEQVAYFAIEGGEGAVEAEACDACHTYTKIMNKEKSSAADCITDDLATMALDILVADAGYRRFGLNPFLLTEES